MSGLVDLPPKLIEKIFAFTEEYVLATQYQEKEYEFGDESEWTPSPKAPISRLTNRYIEAATRRLFIDSYFHNWHIKAADDQSIQKFCMIVNTSDILVKGLKYLSVYVDDDQMISKRHAHLQLDGVTAQNDETTHCYDDETGAMVPTAYFQNRDAIIQAFRACTGLQGLYFYRSARREKLQRDPTGSEDDTGRPWESEASLWKGDERKFDVGTSLDYLLSLAHAADVQIRRISTARDYTGTSSCEGLVKYRSALREMDELLLDTSYGIAETFDYDAYVHLLRDADCKQANKILQGQTYWNSAVRERAKHASTEKTGAVFGCN
jgi:hypothetical protein